MARSTRQSAFMNGLPDGLAAPPVRHGPRRRQQTPNLTTQWDCFKLLSHISQRLCADIKPMKPDINILCAARGYILVVFSYFGLCLHTGSSPPYFAVACRPRFTPRNGHWSNDGTPSFCLPTRCLFLIHLKLYKRTIIYAYMYISYMYLPVSAVRNNLAHRAGVSKRIRRAAVASACSHG